MFFVRDFVQNIHLSPSYLGPNIQTLIEEYLLTKVEGSCSSSGYVVMVLSIDEISESRIILTGETIFTVKYKALTLKPFKGEIIDANVVETNKMGVFASVGPLTVFISNHQIPNFLLENEITKDVMIRLKIIGTKIDSTKIYAVGTLNDDSLGIIS
ncbi:RNA polymerase II subunit 7 [Encephalitozoon hellem]|uniref:DNA-directed RNA polymerase II n=1 Tax=Encephalitozoon hellem TaxID=27973 RepID=A0A9Q9FBW5_ENCHE|nr:RNA polymerase II subunit 7 [Encephalitozoon hellem ATCC 50504]AFM98695.1 RNA polymerase II subunit 7 [Encephalitozoon hellem ATCC 50504]KAG5859262.1 RNA polymerase II subunit 7 [Encephalitozoon hellem]UTX43645.1 DNA-directed RNA polymerase II [Encephalitozoon hellem]WEL39121.1 DNA-directed RNA polymerase II subunit [Encephalitozoon hellem]|eukprot:XP_003887676.1 RNA polymerase II subunit 7 [Encephalitozoon hellem ATCC 50504]